MDPRLVLSVRTVSLDELRLLPAEPWANGLGSTRVVTAAANPGDGTFDWRLSLAEIDLPADFSPFPGVDRHLLLVEGDRLEIEIDGQVTRATPEVAIAFRGEQATRAVTVTGAVRVLNLMTRRRSGPSRSSLEIEHESPTDPDSVVAAISLSEHRVAVARVV